MARPERPMPVGEPLARPKQLAERMARVLNDEDVSDAAIALALLTSGVVNHYAGDATRAGELMSKIRKLEDQLLVKSLDVKYLVLQ